ncbi:hypothetical protein Tco_0591880 [Tanacetum coccineum]
MPWKRKRNKVFRLHCSVDIVVNYAAFLLCKYDSAVACAETNGDNGICEDRDIASDVAKECLLAAAKADPKGAHVWTNIANAYYMAAKLESNCLATRYAIAVHRIREAERSQNPSEQLSWSRNEMASILAIGSLIKLVEMQLISLEMQCFTVDDHVAASPTWCRCQSLDIKEQDRAREFDFICFTLRNKIYSRLEILAAWSPAIGKKNEVQRDDRNFPGLPTFN